MNRHRSNYPPGVTEATINKAAGTEPEPHWCQVCDRQLHGARQKKVGLCVICENLEEDLRPKAP